MEPDRTRKDVLLRLKRIEGQVRGLRRMVEEGAPCTDILTQVAAATAAMKKVGRVIVQCHMDECLQKDFRAVSSGKGETLRELQTVIARYIDWA